MGQCLRTLVNVIDVGILAADQNLDLEFSNEKARELLACESMGELSAWWARAKGFIAEALNGVIEEQDPPPALDIEIQTEKKLHRLRLELYPIVEEESRRTLLLVRDRDLIDALETDLRLAARYRSLSRLYGSLAHDLKGPLNAMTINLDLLKTSLNQHPAQDPILCQRQQRYAKTLGDELARLNRSLQNLLDQTVPPAEDVQPFDLRHLLQDLISLIAPQAKRQRVALEIQLGEQTLMLNGHRDTLKQALLNIAVNALEAMPDGGRLQIQLETRRDRAIVSFRDSGMGIPSEIADKIWEMHFTTKKTGTGIGLWVARSIIESFGGAVRAEALNGQGTDLIVSLPLLNEEA